MAQGDQVGRAFGSHDAGEPCHREHIALLDGAGPDALEGGGCHEDRPPRERYPVGLLFAGHVDHDGASFAVEMGEVYAHTGSPISLRVAVVTSGWRINASPI